MQHIATVAWAGSARAGHMVDIRNDCPSGLEEVNGRAFRTSRSEISTVVCVSVHAKPDNWKVTDLLWFFAGREVRGPAAAPQIEDTQGSPDNHRHKKECTKGKGKCYNYSTISEKLSQKAETYTCCTRTSPSLVIPYHIIPYHIISYQIIYQEEDKFSTSDSSRHLDSRTVFVKFTVVGADSHTGRSTFIQYKVFAFQ